MNLYANTLCLYNIYYLLGLGLHFDFKNDISIIDDPFKLKCCMNRKYITLVIENVQEYIYFYMLRKTFICKSITIKLSCFY